MDRACAQCHGGLLDDRSLNARAVLGQGLVVPPPIVAPHHARQIPAEVGNCAECHHDHRGDKGLLRVTEDHCVRCHRDLQTVDGQHTFSATVTAFATDHPSFGEWRVGGLQDTGKLHFNHRIHMHLEEKGWHGTDEAWKRLKKLQCGFCHQPDSRGHRMAPVRYDRDCAECHPLAVRLVAHTSDSTVRAYRLSASNPPPTWRRTWCRQSCASVCDFWRSRTRWST
jgi:predicted CXXCH cytochrome family protein